MKLFWYFCMVYFDFLEDEFKVMGEYILFVWWYWFFEVDFYGVLLWKFVEVEYFEDMERGLWEEWDLEFWLKNLEEIGIWLLGIYQNYFWFSFLDELFFDDEYFKELVL